MKVIFTGLTGTDKTIVAEQVIREYFRLHGSPSLPSTSGKRFLLEPSVRKYFCWFSLEEEIKEAATLASLTPFLDEPSPAFRARMWRDGFKNLCSKLRDVPEDTIATLIDMHTWYFRGSERLRYWNMPDLASIKPTRLVTLFDDSYAIYARINQRERDPQGYTASYLSLSDILEWRRKEVEYSDLIAQSLGIKNFPVAIKHNVTTLYRLLFEDSYWILYLSFPISKPRQDTHVESGVLTEGQKEINQHRLRLYKSPCIVLDPLTIDERSLQYALIHQFPESDVYSIKGLKDKELCFTQNDRWPALTEFPPMVPDSEQVFPIKLPAQEVSTIIYKPPYKGGHALSEIDKQIRYRDFHYIDMADRSAIYRPYYKGEPQDGVIAEMFYSVGKAIIYHSLPDDGEENLSQLVFKRTFPTHPITDIEQYYKKFEIKKDKKLVRLKEGGNEQSR